MKSLGLDYRQGDPWDMWLYGVVAPLPVAGMALVWIISRHAVIQDRGSPTVLHGTDAVALGVTALCLALLLHFNYFWGLSEHSTVQRYHMVGKAVSFLGLIIGLIYMIWCLFRIYILYKTVWRIRWAWALTGAFHLMPSLFVWCKREMAGKHGV